MLPNGADIVKTLRSLLIPQKNGLLARHLMRDFRDLEGCVVPFHELGFKSFEQFLSSSNEFVLTQTPEGVHVYAKIKADSLHIAQLVASQNQNRPKKKKTAKPAPFVMRNNRNLRSDDNWTRTAYANKVSFCSVFCAAAIIILGVFM